MPKLIKLVQLLKIVEADVDEHLEERPAILIRDRFTKEVIRYPQSEYLSDMENLVRRYNRFHLTQSIVFLNEDGVYENVFSPVCRIFSNGMDCKGGRYFRGIWLGLTGKGKNPERGRILINGNRTVEKDFSAFQPRLLYHIAKLTCPDDPYLIPELVERLSHQIPISAIRLIAKLAMVIMINRSNKRYIIGHTEKFEELIYEAVNEHISADELKLDISVIDIFEACEKYHEPISHMFYQSWGLDLMYLEYVITM